jgi:autotransporter-associated beta strand protein
VPGASEDAYFSSLTTAQSVNLDANQAVTGLYFGAANTATTVIQAGGTNRVLTLGTGGITIASGAGSVTLGNASSGQNVAITLAGAQSWTNNSTSALTISNALNNGGYLLTSAGSGNIAIAGAISGSGAVTKVGAGSLMLSASNTFSGGLTMGADAGTVIVYTNAGTNVSGLGSGAVAIGSDSTLELKRQYTGAQTVLNNTFTGTGLLKLSSSTSIGGNRFHLYGINGFSGTVELAFSGSQSYSLWGTINAPNATLQINSGNTLKETLENPSHPRENAPVIAGADLVHGQQAARIWRLRTGHG